MLTRSVNSYLDIKTLCLELGVLCDLAVKCISLVTCSLRLVTNSGGSLPSIRCDGTDICDAADTREPFAARSGISRASRVARVPIQRIAPALPRVISAGN